MPSPPQPVERGAPSKYECGANDNFIDTNSVTSIVFSAFFRRRPRTPSIAFCAVLMKRSVRQITGWIRTGDGHAFARDDLSGQGFPFRYLNFSDTTDRKLSPLLKDPLVAPCRRCLRSYHVLERCRRHNPVKGDAPGSTPNASRNRRHDERVLRSG